MPAPPIIGPPRMPIPPMPCAPYWPPIIAGFMPPIIAAETTNAETGPGMTRKSSYENSAPYRSAGGGLFALAASAASATIDAARDWLLGTPADDWVSMAVVSDGSYGVPEGLISSFPVTVKDGTYEIVQGLEINDFSRARIDASVKELEEEREAVRGLGLI